MSSDRFLSELTIQYICAFRQDLSKGLKQETWVAKYTKSKHHPVYPNEPITKALNWDSEDDPHPIRDATINNSFVVLHPSLCTNTTKPRRASIGVHPISLDNIKGSVLEKCRYCYSTLFEGQNMLPDDCVAYKYSICVNCYARGFVHDVYQHAVCGNCCKVKNINFAVDDKESPDIDDSLDVPCLITLGPCMSSLPTQAGGDAQDAAATLVRMVSSQPQLQQPTDEEVEEVKSQIQPTLISEVEQKTDITKSSATVEEQEDICYPMVITSFSTISEESSTDSHPISNKDNNIDNTKSSHEMDVDYEDSHDTDEPVPSKRGRRKKTYIPPSGAKRPGAKRVGRGSVAGAKRVNSKKTTAKKSGKKTAVKNEEEKQGTVAVVAVEPQMVIEPSPHTISSPLCEPSKMINIDYDESSSSSSSSESSSDSDSDSDGDGENNKKRKQQTKRTVASKPPPPPPKPTTPAKKNINTRKRKQPEEDIYMPETEAPLAKRSKLQEHPVEITATLEPLPIAIDTNTMFSLGEALTALQTSKSLMSTLAPHPSIQYTIPPPPNVINDNKETDQMEVVDPILPPLSTSKVVEGDQITPALVEQISQTINLVSSITDGLNRRADDNQDQLDNINNEKRQLIELREQIYKEKLALDKQRLVLEEQASEIKRQKEELQERAKNLEGSEISRLKATLSEKDVFLRHAKQAYSEGELRRKGLEVENGGLKKEVDMYKQKCDSISQMLKISQSEIDGITRQMLSDNEHLKEEKKKVEWELEAEKRKFQTARNDLASERKKGSSARVFQLESELDSERTQVNFLRKSLTEAEDEIHNLKRELGSIESVYEDLNQQKLRADEYKRSVKELDLKLEDERKHTNKLKYDFETEIAALKSSNSKLESIEKMQQHKVSGLMARSEALSTENVRLVTENDRLTGKIAHYEKWAKVAKEKKEAKLKLKRSNDLFEKKQETDGSSPNAVTDAGSSPVSVNTPSQTQRNLHNRNSYPTNPHHTNQPYRHSNNNNKHRDYPPRHNTRQIEPKVGEHQISTSTTTTAAAVNPNLTSLQDVAAKKAVKEEIYSDDKEYTNNNDDNNSQEDDSDDDNTFIRR